MPRPLPMQKCVKSQLGTTLHRQIRPARFKNRPKGVKPGGIARYFMRRAPAEDDQATSGPRNRRYLAAFDCGGSFSSASCRRTPAWDPAIFSRAGVAFPNQAPAPLFGAKRPENRI